MSCSPGSTVGACSKEESLKYVAESINRAHKETEFVIPVIENMVRPDYSTPFLEHLLGAEVLTALSSLISGWSRKYFGFDMGRFGRHHQARGQQRKSRSLHRHM